MAQAQVLSPDSWQYRALNAVNPGLSYLSDALIELAQAAVSYTHLTLPTKA